MERKRAQRLVGNRITPRQDVLNGLHLLLVCQELLGEVFDSFANEASLGDGSVKKMNFVSIPHLSQFQPEMAILDYH